MKLSSDQCRVSTEILPKQFHKSDIFFYKMLSQLTKIRHDLFVIPELIFFYKIIIILLFNNKDIILCKQIIKNEYTKLETI